MNKVLVFVHGAGKQPRNYAEGPLAEIALLLSAEPLCVPVYYADICNIGSPVSVGSFGVGEPLPEPVPTPNHESPAMAQFKEDFTKEVLANTQSQPCEQDNVAAKEFGVPFLVELVATEVNEIARYLFEPATYHKIQVRMCDGLAQAAQQGDELVVVSHSLGTVVAFDALRAMCDDYNISTFFTLGSPLALLRRLGHRPAELNAITAAHVQEWQNWYCTADPISSVLGPSFPQRGYRLRDVYVNVAPTMPAAHDYLCNPEVLAAIAQVVH